MKKILIIIILCNSFLSAMENKQLLIRKLMRARVDNRSEYSQITVFSKSPEIFVNQGTVHNTNEECWKEIEKGNFVYAPCYAIFPSTQNALKPEPAIIVGTKNPEDKENLKNIFYGISMQTIRNASPIVVLNTINNTAESQEHAKSRRARL